MLSDFLLLVDKLILLIQSKEKNKKDFFLHIIKPFFSELEIAVTGYFQLYSGYGAKKEELIKIRDEYIQTRIKVTSLIEAYRNISKTKELVEFFELVESFFFGDHKLRIDEPYRLSEGRKLIDLATGNCSEEYRNEFEDSQDQLAQKWRLITKKYGELQVKYELPIEFMG